MYTKVKTKKEIDSMRQAGKILANVLQLVSKQVQPGVSTETLAKLVKQELAKLGGKAAFLGYFPGSICASINDEVVHGIPHKDKVVQEGDIVSLDLGVKYSGMIVDGAISLIAGKATKEDLALLNTTKEALQTSLNQIKAGCQVGDISQAVQAVLDKRGYGIVKDLVGHGVGHMIHEDPNIPNYGHKGSGPVLEEGMTIAVEPMATLGTGDVYVDEDGWTVKTKDGSKSCHFEHTILITKAGCEVLTSV